MTDPADTVPAQLAELRKKYGRALPEKVAALTRAVQAFVQASRDEQACAAAYRQVHSLAGSSGTYGFPDISGVARAAEAILRQSLDARAPLSEPQSAAVDELTARLAALADAAAGQVSE